MGISELLFICFIIIILYKPEKLGEYITKIKSAISAVNETKKAVSDEFEPITDTCKDIEKDINNIITPEQKGDE